MIQSASDIGVLRIAFICSANVCRSPMAHAIGVAELLRRGVTAEVLSGGTMVYPGMLAAREARLVCDQRGTPMPKFLATDFRSLNLTQVLRVFVMEEDHVAPLVSSGVLPGNLSLLGDFDPQGRGREIPDPICGGPAAFAACYDLLRDCIRHYLNTTRELSAT